MTSAPFAAAMIPVNGPALFCGSEKTRLDPASPVLTFVVKSIEQPVPPLLAQSWLLVCCNE